MLLVNLTCLADQTVAERMRALAGRMQADPVITEQAVDEAVAVFQRTRDRDDAIAAGLDFILAIRAEEPAETPQPQLYCAWIEHPAVMVVFGAIVAAIVVGRVMGWIQ